MNRRGFKKNSKCEKVHWLAAASTDGSHNNDLLTGTLTGCLHSHELLQRQVSRPPSCSQANSTSQLVQFGWASSQRSQPANAGDRADVASKL